MQAIAGTNYQKDRASMEQAYRDVGVPVSEIDNFANLRSGVDHYMIDEKHAPWGGYFMPMDGGGIATRWNAKAAPSFGGPTAHFNTGLDRTTYKRTYFKTIDTEVESQVKEAANKTVSDAEVTKFLLDQKNVNRIKAIFEKQKDALTVPAKVAARHIFLSFKDKSAADIAAIETRARAIAKMVTDRNFEDLVAKYSKDTLTVKNGGKLGMIPQGGKDSNGEDIDYDGQVVRELETPLFALSVGEIGLIKTSLGIHIMQVTQKSAYAPATFSNHVFSLAKATMEKDLRDAPVIARIKKLSKQKFHEFSAAEKFDLYLSRYDFVATKWEQYNRGPYRDDRTGFMPLSVWEGFCNGARAAAIALSEPKHPITVTNAEGIEITFEPNDLKILATGAYFYVDKYQQMGQRTAGYNLVLFDTITNPIPPNMAMFDIMVRSFLAEHKKPFIIDKNPGSHLWNVIGIGFDRRIKEVRPATAEEIKAISPKVTKVALVELTLQTLMEVDMQIANLPTVVDVAAGKHSVPFEYAYRLYLDDKENIIDGEAVSGSTAPDFVWFVAGRGMDDIWLKDQYVSADLVGRLPKIQEALAKGEKPFVGNYHMHFNDIKKLFEISWKK